MEIYKLVALEKEDQIKATGVSIQEKGASPNMEITITRESTKEVVETITSVDSIDFIVEIRILKIEVSSSGFRFIKLGTDYSFQVKA